MNPPDFCHIHIHNEFSQLDGFGTAEDYATRAAALKYKYLGLTNHGNMDGLIKFQKACKNHNLTPVLGCEAYIVEDATRRAKGERRGHVCLWVKNQTGFKNLCNMLTYANLKGMYYKPRIDYDTLLENCEGLVISTACMASFILLDGGLELFSSLYDRISTDLYLEIMPHIEQKQVELNKQCIQLSKEYDLKVIATNDCHYVAAGDYNAQEVLLAMQRKTTWNNPKRWRFSMRGLHLKTRRDMKRAFERQGFFQREYFHNTLEVAEKCSEFTIEPQHVKLPRVQGIKLKEEAESLHYLCDAGFHRIFNRHLLHDKKYHARFQEEFGLIKEKRFIRYFLIVWELVKWCKDNEIGIGPGRGSVGGSLIAYLLGITSVDPIKHNLLFSRFINEDRIDFPDIDLDFEHTKRQLVRAHLAELYGEDNVAGVSSFNHMNARAVIRDVSRVFEVPNRDVDRFAKLIEDNDENTGIQDAIDAYTEGEDFNRDHPHVVKFAKKLEGQVRGYGQHAAALVISREAIGSSGRCNLLERDGTRLVNWEKDDTEYVGLMKLDVLGLKMMSVLGEAKKLVAENHGLRIEFDKINLEDEAVLKEIRVGNTVGLFQLNTWAMTNLIKEIAIDNFDQIAAATALVRPGPSNSGMTGEYIKRKHGQDWNRRHPIYEEITEETYGLLVYQEQVMAVIHSVAGLAYSTADKIRKIIGKKRDPKEFESFKQMFIEGCEEENIFSTDEAEEFWEGLQKWAKYGFNKAHSVVYAMLGYWCGWLKKYYPTEFICAALTYGAEEKKPEVVEEAYRLGLTLVLPKVGISDPIKWVAKGKKLHIPFIEVKGIGDKTAFKIARSSTQGPGLKKFFNKKTAEREVKKETGKMGALLDEIGAYNPNAEVQITNSVKSYFGFRVVTNPKENYGRLYELFDGHIRLDRLDAILAGDYKLLQALAEDKQVLKRLRPRARFQGHPDLMSCERCELRGECTRPVPPSPGKYPIIIGGEAPGPDEDTEGEGFVGRSGQDLWKNLARREFHREMFHVTNLNKCYPQQSRKPNAEQVKRCSRFLRAEIAAIKPVVFLAFGNNVLNFFTGRKSGITALSGKTMWNEEYGMWVCLCLHPAAVLHNPDNETYFKTGMRNFVKTIRALGLQPKA